jgi:hypothetical protein
MMADSPVIKKVFLIVLLFKNANVMRTEDISKQNGYNCGKYTVCAMLSSRQMLP